MQAVGGVRSLNLDSSRPLLLATGETLSPLTIAFESYGALNSAHSNAVLVCHGLHGDQFVASPNPVTGRPAWWPRIVGPGRPIDTNRFFVVCANMLGGSMGTTGPASLAPDGQPYGLRFPMIGVADIVRAQALLLEALGIDNLFLVIGAGMGGMQALNWASAFPKRVFACASIASAARQPAQNIAFAELGRQAIMADPDWRNGGYLAHGVRPSRGAALVRAAAKLSGLAGDQVRATFKSGLAQERLSLAPDSREDRSDPNSHLYLSRAMDAFDLAAAGGEGLTKSHWGPYCAILHDRFANTLRIVRDPMGARPIFHTMSNDLAIAFTHLRDTAHPLPLAPELAAVDRPVVLIFGLLRPYKGIDVALQAWRGIEDAELWIVGMPRMDTTELRRSAPPGVRFVERFVADRELPALFGRADLVLLPYREAEQSGVLATALRIKYLCLIQLAGFEFSCRAIHASFESLDELRPMIGKSVWHGAA